MKDSFDLTISFCLSHLSALQQCVTLYGFLRNSHHFKVHKLGLPGVSEVSPLCLL